ncbi:MAG: hypothetical protein HC892_15685 [Saprospiraceae bacterium]|nr:hypothetical protein [Saprospiraceae bacterium]
MLDRINSLAQTRGLKLQVILSTIPEITTAWTGDPVDATLISETVQYNNLLLAIDPASYSTIELTIVDGYDATQTESFDGIHLDDEGNEDLAITFYNAIAANANCGAPVAACTGQFATITSSGDAPITTGNSVNNNATFSMSYGLGTTTITGSNVSGTFDNDLSFDLRRFSDVEEGGLDESAFNGDAPQNGEFQFMHFRGPQTANATSVACFDFVVSTAQENINLVIWGHERSGDNLTVQFFDASNTALPITDFSFVSTDYVDPAVHNGFIDNSSGTTWNLDIVAPQSTRPGGF